MARHETEELTLHVPTESLDCPSRTGHISFTIGKYLIIWGGYRYEDGNYDDYISEEYLPPDELWVYNTDSRKWVQKDVMLSESDDDDGADYPLGTSGASAIALDGIMYIFGGHTRIGNNNWLYKLDVKTEGALEWRRVLVESGNLPSPRDKFAAWSFKGKLYIFGGFGPHIRMYDSLNQNGTFVEDGTTSSYTIRGWNNQLLSFDVQRSVWSNPKCKGVVPCPRAAHAVAQFGDKVYMFGGRFVDKRMNDLHCLSLETLTWSGELHCSGCIPCGRSWHSFTPVTSTHAFLYGGFSEQEEPLGDGWMLDISTLQWTLLTVPLGRPRLWHTAVCTQENDILVFGGCVNNILDQSQKTIHSNEVLEFRLSPPTLQRLCIWSAVRHRGRTRDGWHMLPQHIYNILLEIDGGRDQLCSTNKNSDNGVSSVSRRQSVCAIS